MRQVGHNNPVATLHGIFRQLAATSWYWYEVIINNTHVALRPLLKLLYGCTIFKLPPGQNGRQFGTQHVQKHFREWKKLYLDSTFIKDCSLGSNWQLVSIGSGNGLAPNRRQAITWTNEDSVHRRIYAALGGDELSQVNEIHFKFEYP